MIHGENFLLTNQPVKYNSITYCNIWNITTHQGDDYTTGCLLDYNYFNSCCKMIAKDLRKQEALDADPKSLQQINFIANLDQDRNAASFFIIEEAKETMLDFSQGAVKLL